MISFEHECWAPIGHVTVLADEFGKHLKIVQRETGTTMKPERLRDSDWSRIKSKLDDWVTHYANLRIKAPEPHPADDAFGKEYVDGLNRDMGK